MEHINFELKDNILRMYHGVNKHVIIPEGVTEISDCIYSKDKLILLLYPPYIKNTNFTIPDFVKAIGRTAFYRSSVEKVICNTGLQQLKRGET